MTAAEPTLDSAALAERIAEIASDKKAIDIRVIDLRGIVSYTDFFVICSGNTERQAKAIHDGILRGAEEGRRDRRRPRAPPAPPHRGRPRGPLDPHGLLGRGRAHLHARGTRVLQARKPVGRSPSPQRRLTTFRPPTMRTCVRAVDEPKGAIAETKIAAAATELDIPVLRPIVEHARYDLAFEIGDRLLRVQCKWGGLDDDGAIIKVSLQSNYLTPAGYVRTSYTADEIDLVAVYCGELDRCYLLPISLAGGPDVRSHLRLTPPKNGQRACLNLAVDFEFAGAVAQLVEHRAWQREGQGFESPQLHSRTASPDTLQVGANRVPQPLRLLPREGRRGARGARQPAGPAVCPGHARGAHAPAGRRLTGGPLPDGRLAPARRLSAEPSATLPAVHRRLAGIALVLCAGALGVSACGSSDDDSGGQGELKVNRFDSDAAWRLVKEQVEVGQRPAGSPQLRRLAARLRRMLPEGRFEPVPGEPGVRNVVGTLPGTKPGIVIGAHYDTLVKPKGFVGANNGAAGTAVVVEVARALARARRRGRLARRSASSSSTARSPRPGCPRRAATSTTPACAARAPT